MNAVPSRRARSDHAGAPVARIHDPRDPLEGPTRLRLHSIEDIFLSIKAHHITQVAFPDIAKPSLATNAVHDNNRNGCGASYGIVFHPDLSGASVAVKVSEEAASQREKMRC